MGAIRLLLRVIDGLGAVAGALGAICLALIPILILSDIAYGLATRASLTFVWEYAAFLMAATFFLGLAHTLRAGGHVRVALLAEHLPLRGARVLDLLSTGAGVVIAGFIAYAMVQFALDSYINDSVSFTPTATPLHIPQGVVAFGSVLLALQLAARLVRLLINEPPELPPSSDIPSFEH